MPWNLARVAMSWLDGPGLEAFYRRKPLARLVRVGDLEERRERREGLGCRDWAWYMDTVAKGVLEVFPQPLPNLYWGELRNQVRSMGKEEHGMKKSRSN